MIKKISFWLIKQKVALCGVRRGIFKKLDKK